MRKLIFYTLFIYCIACKKENTNIRQLQNIENRFDDLKVNQMQFVGSHNSYRIKTNPKILSILKEISGLLPADLNPASLDYEHVTLTEQLNDYGLRNLELDIYNDPIGGQFSKRQMNALIGENTKPNIPELRNSGFKVLHIPDVDYNTHNFTFVSAIQEIKNWSDKHPAHLPIFIYIEPKESSVADVLTFLPFTKVVPYTLESMDAIDNEIKSVFGNGLDNVFSPDEMIGDYSTLEQAALAKNWPTLQAARGKVFFIIGGSDDFNAKYLNNHPNLNGRTCFLFSEPGNSECAFILGNDAIGNEIKFQNYVKAGYMVRVFTDDYLDAQNNDYTKSKSATAGGSQILTTDYYRADSRWSDYTFRLPNHATAIVNPFSGPLGNENKYIWDEGYPLKK